MGVETFSLASCNKYESQVEEEAHAQEDARKVQVDDRPSSSSLWKTSIFSSTINSAKPQHLDENVGSSKFERHFSAEILPTRHQFANNQERRFVVEHFNDNSSNFCGNWHCYRMVIFASEILCFK